MAKLYKTARGKNIDMDKVKLANETVLAVGNMNVNARGDVLGQGNQVVAGRNQVMDQVYAVPDAPYSPNDPEVFSQSQSNIDAVKSQQLDNVVNNVSKPTPSISQSVPSTPVASSPRGSLASSVKK